MSGPKVVRIVTLEELQAICQQLMAQVKGAGVSLLKLAERMGVMNAGLAATVANHDEQLRRLYAEGRWLDLQKLATGALAFYPTKREELIAEATAAEHVRRQRRRRLADSARTIAEALRVAGVAVPAELSIVTSRAATAPDEELGEMERQVSASLSRVPVASSAHSASTIEAKKLAGRLVGRQEGMTLAEWTATRLTPPTVEEERLDKLAAELATLDPTQVQAFNTRIAAISTEETASRRALLADSLILDLSARIGNIRRSAARSAKLEEAQALLATSSSATAKAILARIARAGAGEAGEDAEALLAEARAVLENEHMAVAAGARRRAVLKALATLGYEVRDTMEQTWLQDGRLVLRKPGTQDYGVEIGAPRDLNSLQVRLVGSDAPSEPRTPSRDADHETIWCGEFDRLKQLLSSDGNRLTIEAATAAGAGPVRTVALPAALDQSKIRATSRPQTRHLT